MSLWLFGASEFFEVFYLVVFLCHCVHEGVGTQFGRARDSGCGGIASASLNSSTSSSSSQMPVFYFILFLSFFARSVLRLFVVDLCFLDVGPQFQGPKVLASVLRAPSMVAGGILQTRRGYRWT